MYNMHRQIQFVLPSSNICMLRATSLPGSSNQFLGYIIDSEELRNNSSYFTTYIEVVLCEANLTLGPSCAIFH